MNLFKMLDKHKKQGKIKIGSRVMITEEYYMEKGEIDVEPFVTVVGIDNASSTILVQDGEGIRKTMQKWSCMLDTIDSSEKLEDDPENISEVKKYIDFIKENIASEKESKQEAATEDILAYLYDVDTEKQRMINEITIRRALAKYEEFYLETTLDEDEKIDVEEAISQVEFLLEYSGIFTEIKEQKEYEKKQEQKIMRAKAEMEDPSNFALLMAEGIARGLVDAAEHFDELDEEDEEESKAKIEKREDVKTKKEKAKKLDCLIDMTSLAKKGRYNKIIGREEEIQNVAETLARKEIRNPLLIGKPGAGKTAIVEELVVRSLEGKIPHLRNKHFYELRMNDLVAGTMYRGQLEERLQNVMQVLEDDKDAVLFIDEIHMIVKAGSTAEDKNDVANALKPYLTSEISIIGSTTYDEYNSTFGGDGALSRRFRKIDIEEKTKEEIKEIVSIVKERFETYHGVEMTSELVSRIVDEVSANDLDNSLIAGAISAVDTICTKMKITEIDEEEAFDKWLSEEVFNVEKRNNGTQTRKIGFCVPEDKSKKSKKEEKIDEELEKVETNIALLEVLGEEELIDECSESAI